MLKTRMVENKIIVANEMVEFVEMVAANVHI